MPEQKKKTKSPVLQKRPAPLLYFGARLYLKIANRLQYNLHASGEKVKGPALLISNHTSNADYKFIASAVKPARISFLGTYHWFTFKKLAFWLKRIGAIPKYQFTTDLEAMKKIRYVIRDKKGVVYIAPEGTVYASGHLGYISPAIAKMVKFLKVPVYASKIQGAGLGNAKWSAKPHKGLVHIDTHLILSAEEVQTLSKEQILERIITSLSYNEFNFQKRFNVRVPGPDKALGFETMFYKCPVCHSEFTLSTSGNNITCSCCGFTATIQDDFTFKWTAGAGSSTAAGTARDAGSSIAAGADAGAESSPAAGADAGAESSIAAGAARDGVAGVDSPAADTAHVDSAPAGAHFFENYSQWYDWQLDEMKKEVSNPNFKLSEEVEYGYDEPGVDNYVKVGKGIMTLTHNGWDYVGTFKDEQVCEHDDPQAVFLATLKVGLHFELPYRFGRCRVFYPKNGLHSMKWHLASLAMSLHLADQNHSDPQQ